VVGPNQRLLLASHLRNLEFLTQEIERLNAEIEEQLRPWGVVNLFALASADLANDARARRLAPPHGHTPA